MRGESSRKLLDSPETRKPHGGGSFGLIAIADRFHCALKQLVRALQMGDPFLSRIRPLGQQDGFFRKRNTFFRTLMPVRHAPPTRRIT